MVLVCFEKYVEQKEIVKIFPVMETSGPQVVENFMNGGYNICSKILSKY